MKLPPVIIEMLSRRADHELRLPSDCEYLSLDIEGKTGTHIGATTLKRLLGFAADDRTPHPSTLDILARYLGYSHWQQLDAISSEGNSGFDTPEGELRSADLRPDSLVRIAYLPDREVTLRFMGDNRYRVVESQNSKLLTDDEVEIQDFVHHHPLFVSCVWRGGSPLGPFTAGSVSGLERINVIEP